MLEDVSIVHLITRLDSVGGAQIHVLELTRYWRRRGINVSVWGGANPVQRFRDSDIPVTEIPDLVRNVNPWRDLRALFAIRGLIEQRRPDVLMLHSSKAGVLGRMAATGTGCTCIFTAHGWSFTEGMPQPWRTMCWLAEYVAAWFRARMITVSAYDRTLALRGGIGSAGVVHAVHNGVDDISPDLLARPETSDKIVMVARFCDQKDHTTLFHALQKIGPRAKVLLVGDGPLEAEAKAEVSRMGLTDSVEFLGARKDVARILSTCGIFVLSTHWEGLPRSIIEAMRAGLPVVATDLAGNPELVDEGVTGYLVPHADASTLAARLSELLSRPDLRAAFGANARKKFVKGFTAEQLFERTAPVVAEEVQCFYKQPVI